MNVGNPFNGNLMGFVPFVALNGTQTSTTQILTEIGNAVPNGSCAFVRYKAVENWIGMYYVFHLDSNYMLVLQCDHGYIVSFMFRNGTWRQTTIANNSSGTVVSSSDSPMPGPEIMDDYAGGVILDLTAFLRKGVAV